jgi:hypothetical protein
VGDTLEDLSLDNPSAKEQHAAVMEVGVGVGGWVGLTAGVVLDRRVKSVRRVQFSS